MKGLKKWTGVADEGERKFKGWSDKGLKAYEKWTIASKEDVDAGKYMLWEKAIQFLHHKAQGRRENNAGNNQKYGVDRCAEWELQVVIN
jgi:hypothetical protein